MRDAIYGLNFQIVSRGKGSSALSVASYQSGERLSSRDSGETFDYSQHHVLTESRVLETVILTPENCGDWAHDRETLWNEVERTHTAKNSQLARWARVTIPREIPADERMELVTNFVQREFVSRGMIADISLQENVAADGLPNPHAHIMLVMRPVNDDGLGLPTRAAPGRKWNDLFTKGVSETDKLGFSNSAGEGDGFVRNKKGLIAFREKWAQHVNDALENGETDARCSHLSHKERGLDKEPQPYIGKAKYVSREKRHQHPAHQAVRDVVESNEIREHLAPRQSGHKRSRSSYGAGRASWAADLEVMQGMYDSERNMNSRELGLGYER